MSREVLLKYSLYSVIVWRIELKKISVVTVRNNLFSSLLTSFYNTNTFLRIVRQFGRVRRHFPSTPTSGFRNQTEGIRLFFVYSRMFRKYPRLFLTRSRFIIDLRWDVSTLTFEFWNQTQSSQLLLFFVCSRFFRKSRRMFPIYNWLAGEGWCWNRKPIDTRI